MSTIDHLETGRSVTSDFESAIKHIDCLGEGIFPDQILDKELSHTELKSQSDLKR